MSRKDDIKNLIAINIRHLQKRKEQKASFGDLHVPPHILIEIENIEAEITKLQMELDELELKHDTVQPNFPLAKSSQKQVAVWFLGLVIVATVITVYFSYLSAKPDNLLSPSPEKTLETSNTVSSTPIEIGSNALFFNDFGKQQDFPTGQDTDGESWYDDGGYIVSSKDTKSSWIWVMPDKPFDEILLETELMPVTDSRITGYVIAVGWQKGNNYHKFEVQPNGECGFFKVNAQIRKGLPKWSCPKLTEDKLTKVHLEIGKKSSEEESNICMTAFIDNNYIGEECFEDYVEGLVGLGTYNGGIVNSKVESQVRFESLGIWSYPK